MKARKISGSHLGVTRWHGFLELFFWHSIFTRTVFSNCYRSLESLVHLSYFGEWTTSKCADSVLPL